MNLYIRTLGFDNMTSEAEAKFIKTGIRESIKEGLKNGLPIDMLEIDIKKIWELLGNLIGESYDEELLDNLFSRFCLGK